MPKKLLVRTLMDSQHAQVSETLLKPKRQYLCYIFWSLWKKISSKYSFLGVSEIFRLFVNILSPDDKYSLSKSECLTQPMHIQLSEKSKKNLLISFCTSRIYIKFLILSKKSWASEVISFWKYRLQKAELLRCPKRPLSEHLKTVNILKGRKQCFVIFFHYSEKKSPLKTLF